MTSPPDRPLKSVAEHRKSAERAWASLEVAFANKGIPEHTLSAAHAALGLLLADAERLEGLVSYWRRQAGGS